MQKSNSVIGFETWQGVHEHLHNARKMQPIFALSRGEAAGAVLAHMRGFLWAMLWKRDATKAREKALDVIATLVRWLEGDMEGGR